MTGKFDLPPLNDEQLEQHREATAERERLVRDITAVDLLLRQEFRCEQFYLSVDRHYVQREPSGIAYVVVIAEPRELRRAMRARAEVAFQALGYRIEPMPGFDVYDVSGWHTGQMSAHERMELLGYVRAAIPEHG